MMDIKQFLNEWNIMREKRSKREVSYEKYIEWKLNYGTIGDKKYEGIKKNKDREY